MGECLNDRPFCRYEMLGIPIQISVCMCWFSIHSSVYSVVGFGVHLVSKKGMLPSLSGHSIVSFIWSSILFIWLKRMSTWSFLVMQNTSSTYLSHHDGGIGHCGPSASSSKIFHVNISYDWWYWGTHCCSLKLLVKFLLEGEHTVLQNKFQKRNHLVFGNAMGTFQEGL